MIFLDTNVMSETLRKDPDPGVVAWLTRHDAELALSTVAIADIAYGIQEIRLAERAGRLEKSLDDWRQRFAGRIFALRENAALAYGEIMGTALRLGGTMSAAGGMIAVIAIVNGGRLATRNLRDFQTTSLELISPWDIPKKVNRKIIPILSLTNPH